jgi:hypothetical protein
MLDPKNQKQLGVADAEQRKGDMREKVVIAAVATIIITVSTIIIVNWPAMRQLFAMTADTTGAK